MRNISLPQNGDIIERDAGPAPMLQWVEIDLLVINDDYQRPLLRHNWRGIRAIAEQFLWSRFSPVLCAPVEGGQFAIIDGQHRAHAAALCGHKAVPCQIVQMDIAEQASSFKSVNANTTKVSTYHIARAALTAGEQWILDCKSVAENGGCRLMFHHPSADQRKPGQIYAITNFQKLVGKYPHNNISHSLLTLLEIEGFNSDKDLWATYTLDPVLRAILDDPSVLHRVDFISFMNAFDIYEAVDGLADENRRRLGRGQSKMSRRDFIYLELKNAIHEAFGDDEPRTAKAVM